MTATFLLRGMLFKQISIHQTLKCLSGRQLPGSGPLPLQDNFLLPIPRLQLLGSTAFNTQSYDPLCGQRLSVVYFGAKEQAPRIICGVNEKINDRHSKTDARTLSDACTSGWFGWHFSKGKEGAS